MVSEGTPTIHDQPPRRGILCFDVAILLVLCSYILLNLSPRLLFTDTMAVGGDTPAHIYLASHLKSQFLGHGRIVSWAPGWWGGFPAFQFYFFLPYMLMALLDLMIPLNVAFKLVCVLGIVALPLSCYLSARWMRLPYPVPILAAIACVPFLFVKSHVMWGANIYSMLAGMIASGLSFAIMLPTIASWYRDAEDGQARLRSVILAWLTVSSHFFTSVVAALIILAIPFLVPAHRRLAALRTFLLNGLRTALLCAWWVLPLLAKKAYSVDDFGVNWDVRLSASLPTYWLYLLPLILAGLFFGLRERRQPVMLFAWMGLMATLLFKWGFSMNPVFVNVRLWPFVFFAFLFLAAAGLGLLVRRRRALPLLVLSVLVLVLTHTTTSEQDTAESKASVRAWSEFNFAGLERRPGFPAWQDLVLPLAGTRGRLANDLSERNNALGSTRIFESVPHAIGKPIVEGGLVNSALSSYFAYTIQCETSESCAGYPSRVNPPSFDLDHATRHLELFNAKHFIARWEHTRAAMHEAPEWDHLASSGPWSLFELNTHDGNYVTIPKFMPRVLASEDWKTDALQWMYTVDALDQLFIWENTPPVPDTALPAVSARAFRQHIRSYRDVDGDLETWLHLGPFHVPPDIDDPLDFNPIDEAKADPLEGDRQDGKQWDLLFERNPIFPGKFYEDMNDLVAYSFVNVFVPTERDALLHYANDDGVRVVLNGETVLEDGMTGLGNLRTKVIRLARGRNRFLHKSQQFEGGQFFQVRLTDTNSNPFPDLAYDVVRKALPATPIVPRPVEHDGRGVISETLTDSSISFTTDAPGLPHLVKCSYYPNWKVRGARAVHLVTPTFMLVYPDQPDVTLYYGSTGVDVTGRLLTLAGWLALAIPFVRRRRMKPTS